MILEIVSAVLIWAGNFVTENHKSNLAKQQALITDQKTYCPPVNSLPNDTPPWKIEIYRKQCSGVASYLKTPTVTQVMEQKKDDDP